MNNQEFRIYRANKNNTGAASAIQLVEKEGKLFVFWTITKQTGTDKDGNASFGWKDKDKTIIFKMEDTDLGEILAVIYRFTDKVGGEKGLFHQNANGNTVFNFDGKSVRISTKKKDAKEAVAVSHGISHAELALLKVIFETIVSKRFGNLWKKPTGGKF
jgi:hypothetical protein